jgi:hypothetical protein
MSTSGPENLTLSLPSDQKSFLQPTFGKCFKSRPKPDVWRLGPWSTSGLENLTLGLPSDQKIWFKGYL